MPQWEETVMGARDRYAQIIKALADKYPSENILLVSHGKLHFFGIISWYLIVRFSTINNMLYENMRSTSSTFGDPYLF